MSSARDPDALAEPGTPLRGDLLAPANVATARVDVDAGPSTDQSATDRAKDAAGEVAQTTVDKTREVADEAKTQARSVVDETKDAVRDAGREATNS